MATETTTPPPGAARSGTVTLDAPEVQAPPATGKQRARNEYPEAYDELEGLEAAAPSRERAKPLDDLSVARETPPGGEAKGAESAARDEAGRFVKQADAAAARASEPPKEAAKDEGTGAKAPDKGAEGSAPATEPDPTAKYQLAHDLRRAFGNLHKEHDALKGETAQLRARLAAKSDETALGEVKQLRKQLEAAEEELRYLDYTKSSKFKEEFAKPYQNALADAEEEVKELYVLDESGTPQRPADAGDLRKILTADKSEVRALAKRMFGEDAQDVLAMRRKLDDMNRNANREAQSYREKAVERERQRALKEAEERDGLKRMWEAKVGEVGERYKQFFGRVEGDDEYNAALEDGYKRIDAAHAPDLPMEEKVTRLAVVRHKAAAFGAQVLLNKRLQGRVKELEEALKEYERSTPASGKGGKEERASAADSNGYKSAEEELEELERKFPGER